MAHNPIVGGPQGAAFTDRWDALYPRPDPNDPGYDLHNTYKRIQPGTQTFPPPWGSGGRITGAEPMMMDALFGKSEPQLLHMAGDVIPGPMQWQQPAPPIEPYQAGGAAGMWNIARQRGPHAVDTLGIELHPEAKRMLELLARPGQ